MAFTSYLKQFNKVLDKAEERTLEGIGEFITGEVILRTPVGEYQGGNLRSSNEKKINEREKSVEIGNTAEYALHVEKGTYKMEEQPYLTPALEQNINRIRKLSSELLKI